MMKTSHNINKKQNEFLKRKRKLYLGERESQRHGSVARFHLIH